MITRSVEFCSLNEVPEADVLRLISQIVEILEPGQTGQPVVSWTHLGARDTRTPLGDGELVNAFRASLTKHVDLRKEVVQRFVDSKFGPIQLTDKITYIANGTGDNLHFELYVNADGHNTVYFLVSALQPNVERFIELFHQNFGQ
ncbi:MAG: hypothetical protein SFY70_11410 [Bacteroidia bacterium]|nr:hypothetical protein [Bacteroidia bacterium]